MVTEAKSKTFLSSFAIQNYKLREMEWCRMSNDQVVKAELKKIHKEHMPSHWLGAALCKGNNSGDDTGEGQTKVWFPFTHPVPAAGANTGNAVGDSLLCTPADTPLLPPSHLTECLKTWWETSLGDWLTNPFTAPCTASLCKSWRIDVGDRQQSTTCRWSM